MYPELSVVRPLDYPVDRRRSLRVDVVDRLRGELLPDDSRMGVVDMSPNGMLIETTVPLEIGSLRQVRLFTPSRELSVLLTVEIVHSRRDSMAARHSIYLSGCHIVGPRAWETQREFDRLMDLLSKNA